MRKTTVVFAAITAVGCIYKFSAIAPAKSSSVQGGAERLDRQLAQIGEKADCYFTVEGMGEAQSVQNLAINTSDEQRSDITWLVKKLQLNLPQAKVFLDAPNSKVIHIVGSSLQNRQAYVLNVEVGTTYKGTLADLPSEMGKRLRIRLLTRVPMSGFIYDNDVSSVSFQVKRKTLRSIITDYAPFSRYNRILWSAFTHESEGAIVTRIEYLNSPVSAAMLYNRDTQPFSRGRSAYFSNPNTEQLVTDAITFINERMAGKSQLNVRWAMFYLGKYKVERGIPTLLKYIDYQYTTTPLIEESYPALRALRQIGKPASDASLAALSTEKDAKRLRLLLRVVMSVNGLDGGQKIVNAALPNIKDTAQRNRVAAEMATVVKQIPNDATATVPDEEDDDDAAAPTVVPTPAKVVLPTP